MQSVLKSSRSRARSEKRKRRGVSASALFVNRRVAQFRLCIPIITSAATARVGHTRWAAIGVSRACQDSLRHASEQGDRSFKRAMTPLDRIGCGTMKSWSGQLSQAARVYR